MKVIVFFSFGICEWKALRELLSLVWSQNCMWCTNVICHCAICKCAMHPLVWVSKYFDMRACVSYIWHVTKTTNCVKNLWIAALTICTSHSIFALRSSWHDEIDDWKKGERGGIHISEQKRRNIHDIWWMHRGHHCAQVLTRPTPNPQPPTHFLDHVKKGMKSGLGGYNTGRGGLIRFDQLPKSYPN